MNRKIDNNNNENGSYHPKTTHPLRFFQMVDIKLYTDEQRGTASIRKIHGEMLWKIFVRSGL